MGEPLHNWEAVEAALGVLCHPGGLQLSPNKVTVSTVGLVPQMRALVARSGVQLAVSLHATTDELRDWLAPANRKWVLIGQDPVRAMDLQSATGGFLRSPLANP